MNAHLGRSSLLAPDIRGCKPVAGLCHGAQCNCVAHLCSNTCKGQVCFLLLDIMRNDQSLLDKDYSFSHFIAILWCRRESLPDNLVFLAHTTLSRTLPLAALHTQTKEFVWL